MERKKKKSTIALGTGATSGVATNLLKVPSPSPFFNDPILSSWFNDSCRPATDSSDVMAMSNRC